MSVLAGEDLAGVAWSPASSVVTADGLRMAVVDLGPPDAPTVLCLHGEPSWSYLYRNVVADLVAAGLRVVVPDLIGFGRSDKPTQRAAHSYAAHVAWLRDVLLDGMQLRDVTLLCQDWGGLLGLRLLAEDPGRFRAVVAANTGLPDGTLRMPEIWWRFREVVETVDVLQIGHLVQAGVRRALSASELAAYDAPFPTEEHKAGPRSMPGLIPQAPTDPGARENIAAWQVLAQCGLPFVTAFSDGDPITAGADGLFHRRIASTAGQAHVTLRGGHFLQEDSPAELAAVVLGLFHELGGSTATHPSKGVT